MNQNNTVRLFTTLSVLALLLGAGAMYMKYSTIQEQTADVAEVQQKVDDAAGVQAELVASQKRIDDLKLKLSHLERGVPDYAYVPTMLRELERFGKANGVDVTGVRPAVAAPTTSPDEPVDVKKSYDELTIEVRGRGQFQDALRFTRALNQFPKIVAARTTSLSPKQANQATTESPVLELVFELRVFVFAQDAQSGSIAPATAAPIGGANATVRREVPNANG